MPVVGVEDGSFQKSITLKALLAVVLFKGLKIVSAKIVSITVDGLDVTKKLAETLNGWQFEVVMLAVVSFAGFNVIDPVFIHEKFGKPIIVISRTKPDNKAVKRALQRHFEDWRVRWNVFEKLGLTNKVVILADSPPVYIETLGIPIKWASELIRALSVYSRIPEPIRVARLVARGLS
jgi:endonuclease V-like protein UPF0215 family